MKPNLLLALFLVSFSALAGEPSVRIWQTNLVIPTYLAAPPSPVPRFYEGRTYQGARATFYPYPVQDRLTEVRSNVTYQALFLENSHLQVSVLPELGGRIFSATDKANGYDFFYRQHVIKPALIGMLGAWISGGVEWNVPHHHRASSFSPVDCMTNTNEDGSATIWVGEIEWRHRLKWLVGLTLYPDRSYLELTCKVFNRTPFAHPMLFWINPAVHANTNYQVLFPPSTEWAVQHAKPEFASWPVARQLYGGTDYTRGVDISWWKNHPTPVSFFAWNDTDDWFGGYDHGRDAGVLHWADHHVVPGKKFFEWGNGPEGEMWSKILTDEDGPYLELMAGAWSDNQPDYSWIQPGETREWKHWWYPVRNMGGVKTATRDAAVNLEVKDRTAKVAVNTTREFKGATVRLELREWEPASRDSATITLSPGKRAGVRGSQDAAHKVLFSDVRDLSPSAPFSATVMLEADVPIERLRVSVQDAEGREVVAYQPASPRGTPMPKPVERPKSPKDYASADELYFTGQRIEQLYSPSFEAAPYYEEMLRRDPGDYRAHTALGILKAKEWRWDAAVAHFTNAIARAAANYIRPKDGEAYYYLGVALKALGRLDEAAVALERSLWSRGWQGAAGCELAEIDLRQGKLESAARHLDLALAAGSNSIRARNLKATVLRGLGRPEAAEAVALETLDLDPLNVRALSERILAQRQRGAPDWRENIAPLRRLMGHHPEAFLENAFDLAAAGHWSEVAEIMRDQVSQAATGGATVVAMEHYLLSHALGQIGAHDEAAQVTQAASRLAPGFSFPSRFEEEPLLRQAMEQNPRDALAPYLLGCLLYDRQPENALAAWEESRRRHDALALTHRNLGLAYAHFEKNPSKAIASLERAVALDAGEARLYYELDLQYEAAGVPVAPRLKMLADHHDVVAQRDDALTREIMLQTVAGEPARALALLRGRNFQNWEGSSQIHGVYVDACLRAAQVNLAAGRTREALEDAQAALEYPENLRVGRGRRVARAAEIHYHIGLAHEAIGDNQEARAAFEQAVERKERAPSEQQYYQGLALQALERPEGTKAMFEGLIKAGQEQLARGEPADYFAKFGEKTSERVRQANAHFLIALGHSGLGQKAEAKAELNKVLELHPAHPGAARFRP